MYTLQDTRQDDSSYIILKENNIIIIQHHEQKHIHRGKDLNNLCLEDLAYTALYMWGLLGWTHRLSGMEKGTIWPYRRWYVCRHVSISTHYKNGNRKLTTHNLIVWYNQAWLLASQICLYKVEIQSAPNIGWVDCWDLLWETPSTCAMNVSLLHYLKIWCERRWSNNNNLVFNARFLMNQKCDQHCQ